MAIDPVVIGDAASQARDIGPDDFIVAWKVTGQPADAVSLDTARDFLETRLRSVLTAIIQADAPTGLTLTDLSIVSDTQIQLDYTVGGHAAHLTVDLAALFTTLPPTLIATVPQDGSAPTLVRGDHAHALPSRANAGETPIVSLAHLAVSAVAGRGMRLGFNSTTGEPEYQSPSGGHGLSSADPQPVGGATAPAPGTSQLVPSADHEHAIASRSVGLPELKAAASAADYGKVVGYDSVTGEPVALDGVGGGTFLSQSDTPSAYAAAGTAPVVDAAGTALEFAGPFQPLAVPDVPTNVRATDAFDMALEVQWAASAGAVTYEWQRKPTATPDWTAATSTSVTSISVRVAMLAFGSYDFRVRAVGAGGHLASLWTELTGIPLIATPTPSAASSVVLSRLRSRTLRFRFSDLDVTNGGSGSARVTKQARHEYQYREVGDGWPALSGEVSGTSVDISGLTDGVLHEARVRGLVTRSDGTNTEIEGPWSAASNQERPVKDTVTLTYGMAASRTDAIRNPRSLELRPNVGQEIQITNPQNAAQAGEFYALDVDRGDQYARGYDIQTLETRPLATDITAGANYVEEAEPASGPRRWSVGPAAANSSSQRWFVQVN